MHSRLVDGSHHHERFLILILNPLHFWIFFHFLSFKLQKIMQLLKVFLEDVAVADDGVERSHLLMAEVGFNGILVHDVNCYLLIFKQLCSFPDDQGS